jgi:hypothetical protein
MQLSEEQLAQAIAGLDGPGRSRVAALIAEEPARALAAALIRRAPRRRPMDSVDRLEAVVEAIAAAGDAGITYTALSRRLRMPAAQLRKALEHAVECDRIEFDLDERTNGRGRPATRFRASRQKRFTSQPSQTPAF